MNNFFRISCILSVIFLSLISSCSSTNSQTEPQVSVSEFVEARKAHPEAIIIDVRTPGEYKQGTMEGAINVDIKSSSFKDQVKNLDQETTVMVFCKGGVRSAKAKKELKAMGFSDVIDLEGGFTAWKSAGGEVVKP
ncbi:MULTISPECIES: rhodanese-like domain-containing protein [Flammeovirga]|uniref:Rhodanese-like domain-containing protein n=1 Tax=Flammeovirga agarivorans TaxID=2726742 RepID=A0A7X8SIL0_9BACT|nr:MULTISPECIES: rhodanese-like domain-containing protein [Flammeovirga]NLR90787.1 rhodanese-like domain-containing protein [Flammeovirga agarivorans]